MCYEALLEGFCPSSEWLLKRLECMSSRLLAISNILLWRRAANLSSSMHIKL